MTRGTLSITRLASIAVMVGLATLAGSLWIRSAQLERQYHAALETSRHVERYARHLHAERTGIAEALSVERQRAAQAEALVAEKTQALEQAMARLLHEERAVQHLQEKLATMQQELDLVQGELAVALQMTAPEAAPDRVVQLDKVIVSHGTTAETGIGVQGRVLSVHPEWGFVVVSLGWDFVQIGDRVAIYRDEHLLGEARIERVQEQASAATLLPDWQSVDVHEDDVVRVL